MASLYDSFAGVGTTLVWLLTLALVGGWLLDRYMGTSLLRPVRARVWDAWYAAYYRSPWGARVGYVLTAFMLMNIRTIPTALTGLGMLVYGAWRLVLAPVARYAYQRVYYEGVANGYVLPFWEEKSKNVGWLEQFAHALKVSKTGSILALGTTRSGKSEVGKTIVYQMQAEYGEPRIIYDHKDDYESFYSELAENDPSAEPIVLSTDDSTNYWNIFNEIETEQDYDELGRALFPRESGGKSDYFDNSARQVFVAVLKYLDRTYGDDPNATLSNKTLVEFFKRRSREEIHERLSEYPDFASATVALDPDAEGQAVGNYSTLQQRVTDVFVGDFAKEGQFSIREYMQNPGGRPLILSYSQRRGESIKPAFRFFIDHSAMYALDDPERNSYFVLDEFAQIPGLRRIDELVNVGAGQNVQLLVTLQSVSQLFENYSKDAGQAILSGLRTQVILRLSDDPSIEHARTVIGTEFNEYTKHVERGDSLVDGMSTIKNRETKLEEEHEFAKGDFTKLDPGVGVVVRPNSWAFGYMPRIYDTSHDIAAAMNVVAEAREHGYDPTPSLRDTIADTLNIGLGGSRTTMQPNPEGSEYKYGPDSETATGPRE